MQYIYSTEIKYMKNSVSTIPSPYIVITTLVYALLAVIMFLELDNTSGEETFLIDEEEKIPTQEVVEETPCKSPCPKSAEMCIQMCA
jgi:hypothetical protein